MLGLNTKNTLDAIFALVWRCKANTNDINILMINNKMYIVPLLFIPQQRSPLPLHLSESRWDLIFISIFTNSVSFTHFSPVQQTGSPQLPAAGPLILCDITSCDCVENAALRR